MGEDEESSNEQKEEVDWSRSRVSAAGGSHESRVTGCLGVLLTPVAGLAARREPNRCIANPLHR